MKEKFNSIDLFKFIMAIVVVAFHTNPFDHCKSVLINEMAMTIADMSVPFFFIASGYLLAVRWGDTRRQREKYIYKTLISTFHLYTIWTLLSLPLTLYGYMMSGNDIVSCILSYVKYFLFVGKLYNSYHLWYLLSMIYALIVMLILIHRGKNTSHILVSGVICYAIYLLFIWIRQGDENVNGWLVNVGKVFYFVFNNGGVFTGLLYMGIGIYLRQHKRMGLLGGVVGVITGVFVRYALLKELGNMLSAVMVFILVINIKLSDSPAYMILRRLSKYMYLSHLLCFSFYTFIIIDYPNKLGVDSFLVTTVLSIMLSAAIIYLKGLRKGGIVTYGK